MIRAIIPLGQPFEGKPRASGDDPAICLSRVTSMRKPRASGDDPRTFRGAPDVVT